MASDFTHFSAFDQNIFTEWHSRYRRAKRGVLIYWTVDVVGSMAVHSQLISCSASEVHAMVEGAMRHGTDGELASNRREEQELGMLCLHILQSCLGLINTLMIQYTLDLPEWQGVLTDADRRGLTPIFHTNMTPYGEVQLRTDRRLSGSTGGDLLLAGLSVRGAELDLGVAWRRFVQQGLAPGP
ncbi:hypothetical protein FHR32_000639 [Streptosporangium album]|uniref:Tn3 transposase DDE domain-containing protein n=1 Tax=Streptosporangium album TaxID=47479 RepID=A0A7W7RQI3_9ACTN|nr:hypothetical protein [Streptosporangium album]